MPSARELLPLRKGYRIDRQTGSHTILEHPSRRTLAIPAHRGDLPKGLFLRILKDSEFSLEEFRRD